MKFRDDNSIPAQGSTADCLHGMFRDEACTSSTPPPPPDFDLANRIGLSIREINVPVSFDDYEIDDALLLSGHKGISTT